MGDFFFLDYLDFLDCEKQNQFQYNGGLKYSRVLCHCRYQEMDLNVRLMDEQSIRPISAPEKKMTRSFV